MRLVWVGRRRAHAVVSAAAGAADGQARAQQTVRVQVWLLLLLLLLLTVARGELALRHQQRAVISGRVESTIGSVMQTATSEYEMY